MLGAVAWSYWMHVPLLAAALLGVLVTAARYYRDFAVPLYQWRLQAESQAEPPSRLASVHTLGGAARAAQHPGREERREERRAA